MNSFLNAFELVSDAWAVLSDPVKKAQYDKGFEFEDLGNEKNQNCEKLFHGVSIPSLPPIRPGQEAYYVSWGMFSRGFGFESLENGGGGDSATKK